MGSDFDGLSGSPGGKLVWLTLGKEESSLGEGRNQCGWVGNKRQKEVQQGCGYTWAPCADLMDEG